MMIKSDLMCKGNHLHPQSEKYWQNFYFFYILYCYDSFCLLLASRYLTGSKKILLNIEHLPDVISGSNNRSRHDIIKVE